MQVPCQAVEEVQTVHSRIRPKASFRDFVTHMRDLDSDREQLVALMPHDVQRLVSQRLTQRPGLYQLRAWRQVVVLQLDWAHQDASAVDSSGQKVPTS
jgi:hypothetical protein